MYLGFMWKTKKFLRHKEMLMHLNRKLLIHWFLLVLENFDESLMTAICISVFLVNFRAHSENEGTSLPSADSCTSPTKMDLSYSKTAKQCLEEISGKWPDWCTGQTQNSCNLST